MEYNTMLHSFAAIYYLPAFLLISIISVIYVLIRTLR